jgi:hypothetical protein
MGKKYGRGYIYYGEPERLKSDPVEDGELEEDELLKEDAVLVVGGTGRTGQWITLGLLNQGFNVRVLTRSFERAEKLFGPSGSNVCLATFDPTVVNPRAKVVSRVQLLHASFATKNIAQLTCGMPCFLMFSFGHVRSHRLTFFKEI